MLMLRPFPGMDPYLEAPDLFVRREGFFDKLYKKP